ncbi:MAG: biotin--[acetyl-CoA-carboxylase] ligase [Actinomycetota bacterium]
MSSHLDPRPDMRADLTAAAIAAATSGRLGAPLRTFAEIGSTSTEALEWADEGAPEGALVVADHQTAGRGRRGRGWLSEPGRALQFSLVLRPRLPVERAGLVTTCLGVAVAEALEACHGLDALIKWPNDVDVGGRKVAGILVESRVANGIVASAVAGVGINVGWRCDEVPEEIAARASSVRCELERLGRAPEVGRAELLGGVLARLEPLLDAIGADAGASDVVRRATARSEVVGRAVRVRLASGAALEGVALGLLETGSLELDVGGTALRIEVGEIERVRLG